MRIIESGKTEKSSDRILFISTPRSWRGGEQQLLYLMEELTGKNKPFTLVCPLDSVLYTLAIDRKYEVAAFSRRGILNSELALHIKNVCLKYRFSIIHINDSHAHTASYLASLLGIKIPVVLHRRVDFPVRNNLFSRLKYNWNNIKAIICISKEVKKILLPSIKSPKIVKVVYSGIDLKRFQNEQIEKNLRKKLGIPESAVIVGNVAALAPHKDYPTFVRTATDVVRNNPNVYFLGIGEGNLRIHIQEMIDKTGYKSNIILTGFLEDIPDVLKQLDVFLITSKTEGLGTSILDAFAAKIPVVATSAGGITEIVKHESTGLVAPIGDYKELAGHVNFLLEDHSKGKFFADNASRLLLQFTKEKMAEGVMEIYQQILHEEC